VKVSDAFWRITLSTAIRKVSDFGASHRCFTSDEENAATSRAAQPKSELLFLGQPPRFLKEAFVGASMDRSPDGSRLSTEHVSVDAKITPFLSTCESVNWHHPDVIAQAAKLRDGANEQLKVAERCFEWVRDHIEHSVDFRRTELTCKASDVLKARTGFCYAKSHLLAALLRANRIPAGFCYQRLSIDGNGSPFCLHGLNAVYLTEYGWYRVDARGDKRGITTCFSPPVERLAFSATIPGEIDLPEVWSDPLPVVVKALREAETVESLQLNLPDVPIIEARPTSTGEP
jgi:transglutaminase-like putative cysteine protease